MRTPLLYVIREEIIKGRQRTWAQKSSWFLQPPSTPFHYTALGLDDSETWRLQKIHEFLSRGNQILWSGVVSLRISKHSSKDVEERIRQFLELAFKANQDLLLDFEARFWHKDLSDWLLTYEVDPLRSFGTRIEQYVGKGFIWHRGVRVCHITTEGSVTQP